MLLAYHDRSDGGLFITLCEMAFAGHTGLDINLDATGIESETEIIRALFNEELGAVIQLRRENTKKVLEQLHDAGLGHYSHVIGSLSHDNEISFSFNQKKILQSSRTNWHRSWSETSWQMQTLRDNSDCAQQEFDNLLEQNDSGLAVHLEYDVNEDIAAPYIQTGHRPRIAILREQGVNGQVEMAAAFDRAGFTSVDVHMSDIISGRTVLTDFKGLVACGGFSYGDVLGAGGGWANSVMYNSRARDEFESFFNREDTFGLGVCNGCQMMSRLKHLIPGAAHWPRFVRNQSEQFEARFSLVEINDSPSILLKGMVGSQMPIAVAHGEGRILLDEGQSIQSLNKSGLVSMRFIDHQGSATERYPYNPNGSAEGITSVCNDDGRFTIMMPHPERVFRKVQHSWHPDDWLEDGAWMRMFRNARVWLG
jgi:phosphoribosylformylglycinamidine synthase